MEEREWPSDWLRAVLPVVTLGVLARGPAHGYAVLQAFATLGLGSVKGGTLYPLLARQQALGHVEPSWQAGPSGPARKVFVLTDSGRRELARLSGSWRLLEGVVRAATANPGHHVEVT